MRKYPRSRLQIYEQSSDATRNTKTLTPERFRMDIGANFACKLSCLHCSQLVATHSYDRDDISVEKRACFLTGSTTTLRMHIARRQDHLEVYMKCCAALGIPTHPRALSRIPLDSSGDR